MKIHLDADALSKGTLINPSWQPCRINKYEEKPAATDGSTNGLVYYTVIAGEFKGAGGLSRFNEKALGFAKSLLLALGAKIVTGPNGPMLDAELSKATCEGKLVDVYFARGTSNKGNDFNDPKDFAPIGTMTGYKAA